MKAIILHTAAPTNAGVRMPAGATVAIGGKPGQITADRAKALVADGGAAVATAAPAPAPARDD